MNFMKGRGRLTIENFVLAHAVRVPVAAKANDHQALIFGHYTLVNVPTRYEMREND